MFRPSFDERELGGVDRCVSLFAKGGWGDLNAGRIIISEKAKEILLLFCFKIKTDTEKLF